MEANPFPTPPRGFVAQRYASQPYNNHALLSQEELKDLHRRNPNSKQDRADEDTVRDATAERPVGTTHGQQDQADDPDNVQDAAVGNAPRRGRKKKLPNVELDVDQIVARNAAALEAPDSDDDQPRVAPDYSAVSRCQADLSSIAVPDAATFYFDGGCRGSTAASAVYFDDAVYCSVRFDGSTSQQVELRAAIIAMKLAAVIVGRGCKRITIIGDSHHVVMTLLHGYESVLQSPKKSPLWKLWSEAVHARSKISSAVVDFKWVPRFFNKKADHISTCCIKSVAPDLRQIKLDKVPPTLAADHFATIMRDLVEHGARSVRSVPPRLTTAWRSVVDIVAGWGQPVAVYLAAAVLLRKKGPPLGQRFMMLSSHPQVIKDWYVQAAVEGLQLDASPRRSGAVRIPDAVIEKLAAGAPARAIKCLSSAEVVDLEDPASAEIVRTKIHAAPTTIDHLLSAERAAFERRPAVATTIAGLSLPAISEDLLGRTIVEGLSRCAAPGPDQWTRETLLASLTHATRPHFALIANMWAAGRPSTPEESLLAKASVVCAWKKPGGQGVRTIGMTNCLLKAVWKIVSNAFLRGRKLTNALYSPGGSINAMAAVQGWLDQGQSVFIADIVDAFHCVKRVRARGHVRETAVGPISDWVYGGPSACSIGSQLAQVDEGVLPGCAGAQLLFVCDSQVPHGVAFADDIACPVERSAALRNSLSQLGYVLSKERVIDSTSASLYLGAPIGAAAPAAKLLREKLASTQATIDSILSAKISRQAQWTMFTTIIRGITWRMAATHPNIAGLVLDGLTTNTVADNIVWNTTLKFAASTESAASEESRRLAYAPLSATGLGLPNFAVDQMAMHATACGLASWPPRPYDITADKDARKAIRLANQKAHDDALSTLKNPLWRTCHHDNHSWLQIRNLHRNLHIRDSAWESALRDTLELHDDKLLYDKCGTNTEPTRDHYHGCSTCSAGWWTIRHNIVGDAFRQAARAFGVITSAGFKSLYGVDKYDDVPDLIVFDGGARPSVIDFSITHQSKAIRYEAAQHRTNQKEKKYADWNSDTAQIIPIVLTTRFTVHDRSTKRLEDIETNAGRRGFSREAVAQMKVALINFEDFRQRQTLTRVHKATDAAMSRQGETE